MKRKKMNSSTLKREDFIAWLKSKHPRTKVGIICEADFCPLAKFLTQTTGVHHRVEEDRYYRAKVDSEGKILRTDGEILYDPDGVVLPKWASAFILDVDDQPSDTISAKKALRLLSDDEGKILNRASQK